ncbi:MAG TPA: condensation domain-containing protein, partial [Pyrinomonadaceae bacterium]|nr:condensation domain-containing protein [Pyrinomonadaceae bacterium]
GVTLPPLKRGVREGELPLSYAQQRLWFADQLTPGSALYNVAAAVRLSGPLNVSALERTLREIIARHEVLRTSFPARDGEPVQVIAEQVEFELPVTDLSALPESEREQAARRLAAEEAETSFDLSTGPLVRARLLRLEEAEHVALFTMHHIVSDGWSVGVLIKEVSQLYEAYSRGEESPLAELPIQYADYAVWQREWLTGEVLDKQLQYWREQLAGAPETLALPTDKTRPAVQTFRGASESLMLPAETSEALKALSRHEDVTLFMMLLSVWQILLHWYSGQEQIVIGTSIANRHQAATEDLIGFFVNTLALRGDLSGNPSYRELLRRVRETCLGAYAHQDLPFEKLVEELRPERSVGHAPFHQVWFTLKDETTSELRLRDLSLNEFKISNTTSKLDLVLTANDTGRGLTLVLEYDSDLFNAITIRAMLKNYEVLLHHIIAQPGAPLDVLKEILTEEHRKQQHDREKDLEATDRQILKSTKRKLISKSKTAATLS